MRPRKLRRLLALAAFGAVLAGTGAGWGIAKADPLTDVYAARNAERVCATLDEVPSVAGVEGIVVAIMDETGWEGGPAGEVIAISIFAKCPEYVGVLDAFIAKWLPKSVVA
jgi:hypothetical protein